MKVDDAAPAASNGPVTTYDRDYLQWKAWGGDTFGTLTRADARLIEAELAKTGRVFPPGSQVLEVGFGNGTVIAYGRERGWDMVGIEVNDALVAEGKRRGFKVMQSAQLTPFADGAFDLVLAFDVLEHVPQDKLVDFLVEVKRVLRSGGILVARFPNGDSPFGLVNQNGDITHVTAIGSVRIRQLASRLGARILYLGGEAQPLRTGEFMRTVHRAFTKPIKKAMDFAVSMLLYPRVRLAFCSFNLLAVLQFE